MKSPFRWRWLIPITLIVTAFWVTPALAYDMRDMLGFDPWSITQTAQAPPADVAKAAVLPRANVAAMKTYEQINGVEHRTRLRIGAAQVDGLIVGAERANTRWRHTGTITL